MDVKKIAAWVDQPIPLYALLGRTSKRLESYHGDLNREVVRCSFLMGDLASALEYDVADLMAGRAQMVAALPAWSPPRKAIVVFGNLGRYWQRIGYPRGYAEVDDFLI